MRDPFCRALRHGSSLRATQDQIPRFEVKSHVSSRTQDIWRGAQKQRESRPRHGKAAYPGHSCLDSRWNLTQAELVPEPTSCAVVIPCFNEAASIAPLVVAVRQHLSTVMVVDDG